MKNSLMVKLKDKLNEIRTDGWMSQLTWLGKRNVDRSASTKFCNPRLLEDLELINLYQSSGLSKRIVDLVASEMTRQWFTVSGDPENKIIGYLEEFRAKNKILLLLRWARLFGGAIAVMGINDGRKLDQPVNEKAIKNVEFIHVFDRSEVFWDTSDLYLDPMSKKFQQVQRYTVNSPITGNNFVVHESRVLRLDGEILPNQAMVDNLHWGDSILQSCYNELKNLGGAYNATSNIIEDFIQTVLKVNNLAQLMASNQDHLIQKRISLIDQSRSVANTLLLDGTDEYSKQASSVSGLDTLLDRFCLALASVTGIPYAILMGQSPSGMQATGEADVRMFYDKIRSQQEDYLQPVLERLVRLIMLSKEGPFGGVEPENWKICFNPLWQMSEPETANFRKTVAETDQIYINMGVLSPDEVAKCRFAQGTYSSETEIEFEGREPIPDPNEEEAESLKVKEGSNADA